MKVAFLPVLAFAMLFSINCQKNDNNGKLEITVSYEKQAGRGSNQYAVWIEDTKGDIVKTLYVTAFTADGGYTYRETSLPVWVIKANPASLSKEQIDAFSGATPSSGEHTYTWDLTDQQGNKVEAGNYIYIVEATYLGDSHVMFKDSFTVGNNEIIGFFHALEALPRGNGRNNKREKTPQSKNNQCPYFQDIGIYGVVLGKFDKKPGNKE